MASRGKQIPESIIERIHKLHLAGVNPAHISKRLKLSKATVYKYLNSKNVTNSPENKQTNDFLSRLASILPVPFQSSCTWEEFKTTLSNRIPRHVFKNDYKPVLLQEIKTLAERNQNLVVGIDGPLGAGKSCLALHLCKLIDPFFFS